MLECSIKLWLELRKELPDYEILLRTFTIARRLFPWATTTTFLPDLIVGTIVSFQYGKTLSIVVFKLYYYHIYYLCFR